MVASTGLPASKVATAEYVLVCGLAVLATVSTAAEVVPAEMLNLTVP